MKRQFMAIFPHKPKGAHKSGLHMPKFRPWVFLFNLAIKGALFGAIVLIFTIVYLESKLPDASTLDDIRLQTPLKIYSSDKLLMAEFGEKHRTPVELDEVPQALINAVIATEDRRFYEHIGVDFRGLLRATLHLVATGTKGQGGSTITMQVARNFFLSRKKSYLRKVNEILLAIKIDQEFSKDEILKLYLNKIYFGKRAYGVQAAAEVYYGKNVKDLTLAQMAMLAGLPQAPSAINPLNNPVAAVKRRNHVLSRMLHYGFISEEEFNAAVSLPLTAQYHERPIDVKAPYVAEMVRAKLQEIYGDKIYTEGLQVYTTINSKQQNNANFALNKHLIYYDQRHGFRGPVKSIDPNSIFAVPVSKLLSSVPSYSDLIPALVVDIGKDATIMLDNITKGTIPYNNLKWARKNKGRYLGATPKAATDVLKIGDIVYVREAANNNYHLSQLPSANAAIVALDPNNGAITALSGGFDFYLSKFNRATQANRQPGSAFKPFIYAAALNKGYTGASMINDAPVVFNDQTLESVWRPQNSSRRFYGPTRLREGLIKSRNLVSIRLLDEIGINHALDFVSRFGFKPNEMPHGLSLALGTNTTTPLKLAEAYAVFANGGFRVFNHFIEKIYDADDNLIYNAENEYPSAHPVLGINTNFAQRVVDEREIYIMNSMLQDAIKHGTGRRALSLNRTDIAGKTGTTNEQNDAWYSGYNPDVICTAWVGYDEPRSLYEYGAQAALPMWIEFMKHTLKDIPVREVLEVPGIVTVRIDAKTGALAGLNSQNTIYEIFREEYAPTSYAPERFHNNFGMYNKTPKSSESLF